MHITVDVGLPQAPALQVSPVVHSELSLQVHQGRLPILEKWSMVGRGNYRERDVWKRVGIRDLLIAFGNTFFLKIGR